jgi:2-aminoadipate transaminase
VPSIRPKFIYLVPSFQNPSGVTLPENRRKASLNSLTEYGVPIIEDAAYRDLRFEGEAPPLMAAMDPRNVIFINTFSKIFNPGVRIGWITGTGPFIETVALAKQGQDQCASTMGQYAALAFAQKGLIEKTNFQSRGNLWSKKRCHAGSPGTIFPEKCAIWTRPEGGFYTWVTFPEKHRYRSPFAPLN